MLSEIFSQKVTLERLCNSAIGPILEKFSNCLFREGFAFPTIRRHIFSSYHFGLWAEAQNLSLTDLNEDVFTLFQKHLPVCCCPKPNGGNGQDVSVGARYFVNYLQYKSIYPPEKQSTYTQFRYPILEKFYIWMRHHRGVKESTLTRYKLILMNCLDVLGDNVETYHIRDIRKFVFEKMQRYGNSHAKVIASALRMFLRYLVSEGICSYGIQEAVPSITDWSQSRLPRYLPDSEIQKILDSCIADNPMGYRDKAILLLLARLGLRGDDIVRLKIDDINWSEGSIQLSGKGRMQTLLPLSQDTGDAILAYLEHGRPDIEDNHLFIRYMPPYRPLTSGSSVSTIVSRYIRKAKIKTTYYGAHVFRHSAATRMLDQGLSLEQIAMILRHRSVETTLIYAKVDLKLLKQIAQPWPEAISC